MPLKKPSGISNLLATCFCIAFAISYLVFCGYYLTASRAQIIKDYYALGDGCFYHAASFPNLLTDKVKAAGNICCLIAMPLVLMFSYWLRSVLVSGLFHSMKNYLRSVSRISYLWLLVLLIGCLRLAYFGHVYNPMSTDEAFSALNFASAPVARLLSYYPVPNNHIFFNLINHFLGQLIGNYILSGRLLSCVFYCLLMSVNFLFIRHYSRSNTLAFLCCAVLSLQFIVWGFGNQARGYALYYLLEWGSFISFFLYFFGGKKLNKQLLTILIICNVLGMWCVPSFLYLLLFQLLTAPLQMIKNKQFYWPFWKAILLTGMGVWLTYLPVFCYSGIDAVTNNSFVAGSTISRAQRWQENIVFFKQLMSEQTFGFLQDIPIVAAWCFLLPLVLAVSFRRRLKRFSGLVFMYIILCLSLMVMIYYMRQFMVFRTLGGHMHLMLMLPLLLIAVLIAEIKKGRKLVFALFTVAITLVCIRMYNFNAEKSFYYLYGQDTHGRMNALQSIPQDFKQGGSVWLSEESFMWHFLLRDALNKSSHDCRFHDQDILFMSVDDQPLSPEILKHYTLKSEVGGTLVYQRK